MYEAVLWRKQGKTVGEYCSVLCVHAKSLQSCPALCNPMNFNLPGSSVHGILQEEYLSGLPFPPPGYPPDPGIEPVSLTSPTLSLPGRFFTTSASCEAPSLTARKLLFNTSEIFKQYFTKLVAETSELIILVCHSHPCTCIIQC